MVQQLSRKGLLNYEKYRGLTLTDAGKRVAASIRERHLLLAELFQLLGLDPVKSVADIEGIEHHVSEATLGRLRALVQHLKRSPLPSRNPKPET